MNGRDYPSNSLYPTIPHVCNPPDDGPNCRRSHSPIRIGFALRTLLSLLLTFLAAQLATAQTWHWVYGENETVQDGKRGVRPTSLNCTGVVDGYIAVGTSLNSSGVGDVYVVRTDNAGNSQWEKTYSVSSTSDDRGESIIEVSGGFIVVGHTTNSSNNTDVLLMKIECDGDALWLKTFGGSDDEFGFDVIEAETGSADGELVVAGTIDMGTDANGYLLRTNASGAYIWDNAYDLGVTSDERFWSLTEVAPIQSQQTVGDIVAVGRSGDYSDAIYQGYVVRVDGTDGTINTGGGLLQGTALYGGENDEQFYSVIELQNPNDMGSGGQPNVVIAGYSSSFSQEISDDMNIYLVKLEDGAPCDPLIQKIVGTILEESVEVAHCIREITFAPGTGADYFQWDIVVAGHTNILSDPGDMLVVTVDGSTLNPNGDMQGFGHDVGLEDAWSVYPVEESEERTEGIIVCGLTDTEWHTPNPNDPQDLYLVKTNNQIRTINCDPSYGPTSEDPEWSPDCVESTFGFIGGEAGPTPAVTGVLWDDIVCTNEENDGYAKRIKLVEETEGRLASQPNPLHPGQSLVLLLNGFNIDYGLNVSVANSLGEEIASEFDQFTPSKGEIRVGTKGWPAGVYHITVRNGERRWTTQVIVLE